MVMYINAENGKAYTPAAREKYIRAMTEVDGAFENWLDENYLASEIVGESKEDMFAEFVEEISNDFDMEYTLIEIELA